MKNRLRIFAGILWFSAILCVYLVAYSAKEPTTWYSPATAIVGIMVGCGCVFGGMACLIESIEL